MTLAKWLNRSVRRSGESSQLANVAIGVFAVLALAAVELVPRYTKSAFDEEQVMANEIAVQCRAHVRELRKSRGLRVNGLFDPQKTGLVGSAMSPITSKPAVELINVKGLSKSIDHGCVGSRKSS